LIRSIWRVRFRCRDIFHAQGTRTPKPLGQLPQAAFPAVVRAQQLPPQIFGIRRRHAEFSNW
jgi:hypothetical protein